MAVVEDDGSIWWWAAAGLVALISLVWTAEGIYYAGNKVVPCRQVDEDPNNLPGGGDELYAKVKFYGGSFRPGTQSRTTATIHRNFGSIT